MECSDPEAERIQKRHDRASLKSFLMAKRKKGRWTRMLNLKRVRGAAMKMNSLVGRHDRLCRFIGDCVEEMAKWSRTRGIK